MKLNNFKIKKIKKEFDPNKHWYSLLIVVFILFILILIYSVYNFLYIKNEMVILEEEAKNNIINSTSSDYLEKIKKNNQLIRDINNLKKNLDKYELKEIEYEKLLKLSSMSEGKSINGVSSTVATSTKE